MNFIDLESIYKSDTWLAMSNDTYHNFIRVTLCLTLQETHGIIWLAKIF